MVVKGFEILESEKSAQDLQSKISKPILAKISETLSMLEKVEKTVTQLFKKMEKAAVSDELAKCLSPVSTDVIQHLGRLKMLKKAIDIIKVDVETPLTISLVKLKKPNLNQDLDIIAQALNLQSHKQGLYEMLHALLCADELMFEAELIEQTINDNRNTNIWLRQIVKNVIAPQFLES